jgi:hypothetical protein
MNHRRGLRRANLYTDASGKLSMDVRRQMDDNDDILDGQNIIKMSDGQYAIVSNEHGVCYYYYYCYIFSL